MDWCCMCKQSGQSVDGLLLYFLLAYDIWSMVFGMFGLDMKVWGIILWIFGALCLMHYVASVERTQYLHIRRH